MDNFSKGPSSFLLPAPKMGDFIQLVSMLAPRLRLTGKHVLAEAPLERKFPLLRLSITIQYLKLSSLLYDNSLHIIIRKFFHKRFGTNILYMQLSSLQISLRIY